MLEGNDSNKQLDDQCLARRKVKQQIYGQGGFATCENKREK